MKEDEKDEAEEDDAWKLTESVFADRRKLCDARAFVNTLKVRASASTPTGSGRPTARQALPEVRGRHA